MNKKPHAIFATLGLGLALVSCAPPLPTGPGRYQAVPFSTLRHWQDENFAQLLPIMQEQCQRILQLPGDARLGGGAGGAPIGGLARDWQPACRALETAPPQGNPATAQFLQTWFTPYYINGNDQVKAFSEVEVKASPVKNAQFPIPVYAKPHGLVRSKDETGHTVTGRWVGTHFEPDSYYTRAQIDAGALDGHGLEIAWVQNEGALFVLQLQGAGRLVLPGGQVVHVAYAARNGQPYTPLGRVLLSQHLIPESDLSMTSIRSWLEQHPDQARQITAQNADYVFFKTLQPDSLGAGSPGAMGLALTPYRSLRANPRYIPFGALVWLETTRMPLATGGESAWFHLTFMQDANAASALGEVSLFTGWGAGADKVAREANGRGRVFLLLPRPRSP